MTQLRNLLNKLDPTTRLWLALVCTLLALVATAIATQRGWTDLAAVASVLSLVAGIAAPTGDGRPEEP